MVGELKIGRTEDIVQGVPFGWDNQVSIIRLTRELKVIRCCERLFARDYDVQRVYETILVRLFRKIMVETVLSKILFGVPK